MTCEEKVDIFARQMDNLKAHLEVWKCGQKNIPTINIFQQSDKVHSDICLTCDAWQALNTDGYFSVTGHWIEEPCSGVWEAQSAVLGFIQLNNAHKGKRFGGALFMVVKQLEIEDSVSKLCKQQYCHSYISRLAMWPVIMHQIMTRWWNGSPNILRRRQEYHLTMKNIVYSKL